MSEEKLNIRKLARLARLTLTDEEAESLSHNLQSILEHFEKLKSVSVEQIEPLSHVHGIHNVFRSDKLTHFKMKDEILKNVPDTSGRFIRVPIIVDQGEEG